MLKRIFEIRNNISIRNRITALAISITLSLVVVVVLLLFTISATNNKVLNTFQSNTGNVNQVSEFIENIYSVIIKSHIISENTLNEDLVDYALQIDLLDIYFNNFRRTIDVSQKDIFEKLIYEADNYVAIMKEINSLELQGDYDKANQIRITREIKSFNKLHSIIKQLQRANTDKVAKANREIQSLENTALRKIYISGGILLVLILLMFLFAFYGLREKMRDIGKHIKIIGDGHIPDKELVVEDNELGDVANVINLISKKLGAFAKITMALNQGKYDFGEEYRGGINAKGLLANAMFELADTLKKNQAEEDARHEEDDKRNWSNSGHALFGEILRKRSHDIKELTDEIIKNLVNYLKANQGGLFLIDGDDVDLISAFAYDRKKTIERKIKMGDGLVGTVALEKNTIFLDEIPKDYIEIESGLGDASPKNLLIVPLNYEDQILGVVELASFKTFTDYEVQFVEEVGHSIASTLLTVKINARTEQLLDESQKQSNELALREIEARNNLEKIRAAQELAKMREADLTGILSAVDNTLMKGEYKLDGTLIMVNDRHLQTMGYQLHEIQGRNIEMFIPEVELKEFRKIWNSVTSGTPRQIEVKRRTKTGDVLWLVNQYTPVTDAEGKISKVLYLAHDVTRYKIGAEEVAEASKQGNDEDYEKEKLKSEKLQKEIKKRKDDLKKIEEKITNLKKYQDAKLEVDTDNEVDKLYSDWLRNEI